MCIGLGLIFGIMKVVNFAQGELLMLGMYVSLYVVGGFTAIGILGPYVAPFGSTPQSVRTPLSAKAFVIGPFAGDNMLFLNQARVFACVIAIVIAVALWLVMERTRLVEEQHVVAGKRTDDEGFRRE